MGCAGDADAAHWAALHAQSVHGTLAGVVTDPTDAVIENAKVSAINMETAATYTGTTTPVGVFRFADVALGHYTVTVSARDSRVQ